MPSETDPLLPRGNSAPEIVGYGFSKPSNQQYDLYIEAAQTHSEDNADEDLRQYDFAQEEQIESQVNGGTSPLRTFAGLFTIVVAVALAITVLMPGVLDKIWDPADWTPPWSPKGPSSIHDRVAKLLTSTPLIDGHNDLAIIIRMAYHNNIYATNFTSAFEDGGMVSQVDLPRLRTGYVGGSFWSAFTPCLANGTDFDHETIHTRSVATTLSQIDLVRRLTQKYSRAFASPLLNSTTALAAFKKSQLLISPIGIEGLHQIGHAFSTLRLYYSLGVRYATLTHNCYNHYADPALVQDPSSWKVEVAPPYWNGLSPAGMTAIGEMNRMGMLVDLAHVSKATMLDVLGGTPDKFNGSRAPVLFSHSSAYKLCPHPRNVPDDVLQLVKKTGSLVMVNVAPDFISCIEALPSEGKMNGLPVFFEGNATLVQVARHVVYIGDLIGYDHVGIGSDFDGIPAGPKGLEDVSLFPELVGELFRMGVSDENAAKVVGRNVLRVWGEAERIASEMEKEGVLPAEDEIDDHR